MTKDLIKNYEGYLKKALGHLEYSFNKVQKMSSQVDEMGEEELEIWESFTSRFSRVAEIFLSKYIRAHILFQDPGFKGTFRDTLHQAEKLELIADVDIWLKIRELRNREAHDYSEETLAQFFVDLRENTPLLIDLKKLLDK